jgi:mono/diheme cytochrome c family protein
MRTWTRQLAWATSLAATFGLAPAAPAATPAELLAGYRAQAGTVPSPERGQRLFTTNFGREMGWSCTSCHGSNPARNGKDDVSGKLIEPLAPAVNRARLTDRVTVENAFRLNCKDVVGRECTAAEKADVLSWLISVKP